MRPFSGRVRTFAVGIAALCLGRRRGGWWRPLGRILGRMIAFESPVLATMEGFAKSLSDGELQAVEISDLGPMREFIAEINRRANLCREVL